MGIELKNVFRGRNSRSMRESLSSGEIDEREGAAAGLTRDVGDRSSKEPVMVEPKTYFANERTFIQWISAALLLLTVSSILMGNGNYNGTSSVIAFAAMILVTYASYLYFRRVRLLRSGEAYGYLDFLGPSILAAGVGLGVFIVFADAIKGSEILPWNSGEPEDDRRYLLQSHPSFSAPIMPEINMFRPTLLLEDEELHQVHGKCTHYDAMTMDSINLLEYQPRDIVLHHKKTKHDTSEFELLVATPQSLVSHPLSGHGDRTSTVDCSSSTVLRSEIPDTELQSITMVGDRLFALSTGPFQTELIEFPTHNNDDKELLARFVIHNSPSTTGSMVFVPSTLSSKHQDNPQDGKFYIYLDGSMHTYHLLLANKDKNSNPTTTTPWHLSRVGSINMKVLNRGGAGHVDNNPITAMAHFEGLTYLLRAQWDIIEAWDLTTATLVSKLPLPAVSHKNDQWVGMAFSRRQEKEEGVSSLYLRRSNNKDSVELEDDEEEQDTKTVVDLHMPLDTFPPQLWTFRLEEEDRRSDKDKNDVEKRTTFRLPDECNGMAMN
jgi:hypothetical protein